MKSGTLTYAPYGAVTAHVPWTSCEMQRGPRLASCDKPQRSHTLKWLHHSGHPVQTLKPGYSAILSAYSVAAVSCSLQAQLLLAPRCCSTAPYSREWKWYMGASGPGAYLPTPYAGSCRPCCTASHRATSSSCAHAHSNSRRCCFGNVAELCAGPLAADSSLEHHNWPTLQADAVCCRQLYGACKVSDSPTG